MPHPPQLATNEQGLCIPLLDKDAHGVDGTAAQVCAQQPKHHLETERCT